MNPSEDIARNSALKENLFVMFACLINRIPLFLTGDPGCSKTLALNLIIKNLAGKNSANKFFH